MPPIETFMKIPPQFRKEHLFKNIELGDIIIGQVDYLSEFGVHMRMICFDMSNKKRDLSDLRFNLFCPLSNAMKSLKPISPKTLNIASGGIDKSDQNLDNSMKSQLEGIYLPGDYLRCIIVNIDHSDDTCAVSLISKNNLDGVELGEISSKELPIHYKNILEHERERFSYNENLKYEPKFNNPACVDLLVKKIGFNLIPKFSLMKELFNYTVPDGEMSTDLLKKQNKQLALQSVQKGISYFKDERIQDAMLSYNKALSYDPENVEAYVARGALSANDGDFTKSIDDLEKALYIDRNHTNAKIYLKEVFIASAVKLEKNQEYKEAIVFLEKSLKIEPESQLILSKIGNLKNVIEKIREEQSKDLYGPTLPSSKDKKQKKHRSKSRDKRRSRSASPHQKMEIIDIRSSSNYSSNESKKYQIQRSDSLKKQRLDNNPYYDNSNSINKNKKSDNHKKEESLNIKKKPEKSDKDSDDDGEDLEDFFNNLKKKKANARKINIQFK